MLRSVKVELDENRRRVTQEKSPYSKLIEESLEKTRFGNWDDSAFEWVDGSSPLDYLVHLLKEERAWHWNEREKQKSAEAEPRKAPMLSDQANVPTPMKIREAPMLPQTDVVPRQVDSPGRSGALPAR